MILRDLDGLAWQVAEFLRDAGIPGLEEAVASYETVGVYFQPLAFSEALMMEKLHAFKVLDREGKLHCVPVCYALGDDLADAAGRLELSEEELIRIHSSVRYTCVAIGFTPGFPYLGPLDERIAGLPRRGSPRVRVPVGAVGITGNQTGIYPSETPGGWNLIGRTPLTIVDADEGFFPISAGDLVKFEPIGQEEFERLQGRRLGVRE